MHERLLGAERPADGVRAGDIARVAAVLRSGVDGALMLRPFVRDERQHRLVGRQSDRGEHGTAGGERAPSDVYLTQRGERRMPRARATASDVDAGILHPPPGGVDVRPGGRRRGARAPSARSAGERRTGLVSMPVTAADRRPAIAHDASRRVRSVTCAPTRRPQVRGVPMRPPEPGSYGREHVTTVQGRRRASARPGFALSGGVAMAHDPNEFGTPLTHPFGQNFWFFANFQTAQNPYNAANTHVTSSDIAFWGDTRVRGRLRRLPHLRRLDARRRADLRRPLLRPAGRPVGLRHATTTARPTRSCSPSTACSPAASAAPARPARTP